MFPVTSPRGEDPPQALLSNADLWFPVTSPRGEDRAACSCPVTCGSRFQSPPREGRIRSADRGQLGQDGFQSPPREGRISGSSDVNTYAAEFPVTSPRGEDRRQRSGPKNRLLGFQSPPREGRIASSPVSMEWLECFQSPPREGRILRDMGVLPPDPAGFQSPPREGRIMVGCLSSVVREVSSHLPARGGSNALDISAVLLRVSSHLPARGGSAKIDKFC